MNMETEPKKTPQKNLIAKAALLRYEKLVKTNGCNLMDFLNNATIEPVDIRHELACIPILTEWFLQLLAGEKVYGIVWKINDIPSCARTLTQMIKDNPW